MSNFFFSHNIFYSTRKLYLHLSIFLTSYLYLLLEEPKIDKLGKGLRNYYFTTIDENKGFIDGTYQDQTAPGVQSDL